MGSVASYNGKPALIKKTGTLFVDEEQHYFEMQINVHNFAMMTRSALGGLKSRFSVRLCVCSLRSNLSAMSHAALLPSLCTR